MTKGQGVREYRACVRCRSRKVKCDLRSVGEPGKPPCAKCRREGAECLLAGSRRGGDYSRYRRSSKAVNNAPNTQSQPGQHEVTDQQAGPPAGPSNAIPRVPVTQTRGDDTVHDSLQNPSDALLILAHAAGQPEDQNPPSGSSDDGVIFKSAQNLHRNNRIGNGLPIDVSNPMTAAFTGNSSSTYALLQDGTLSLTIVLQLLSIYAGNYHHFFPIVPSYILDPSRILASLEDEPFLMTALLAVASKDSAEFVDLNKSIWNHMKNRIFDVVLGAASIRKVGCVEGLLLLGEWTNLSQRQTEDGGQGGVWSVIGLAVRLAYLLRLEENSFKSNESSPSGSDAQRRRLAWTFIYLSDRQVSIRMGQAFWCRGPALSTRVTAQDFPALQPTQSSPEDFASWITAQVELTTVFGNAHDTLFASRSRTSELMMRGDYNTYVDDANRAITAWQCAWGSISVSPHIKSCLTLMREYLRLYVNAFSFQAVMYRASRLSNDGQQKPPTNGSFPHSLMASPDARNIYEAVGAAENLVRIVIEHFDPVKNLRYMPDRFYLYEIHSSVFLYKATVSGAISQGKHARTKTLIRRFISVLSQAAGDENHIASRYANLLHRLWFQSPSLPQDEITGGTTGSGGGPLHDASTGFQNVNSNGDTAGPQVAAFDDMGIQIFDYTDPMEGLFAMPSAFSWDQPLYMEASNQ